MCGIFGSIAASDIQNRMLAVLNDERGKESAGFYGDGFVYHVVGSVREAIINGDVPHRIFDSMLFLGHTRQATSGTVTKANCHPFRYGRILGAHNGVVYNFEEEKTRLAKDYPEVAELTVDSQIIFWLLNKKGETALQDLEIYSGAWWLNLKEPSKLYLWNFANELHFGRSRDAFLFSSDREHLKLVGCRKIKAVAEAGQVVVVDIAGRRVIERRPLIAKQSKTLLDWKMLSVGVWNKDNTLYQSGNVETEVSAIYRCNICEQYFDESEVQAPIRQNADTPAFCLLCGSPVEEVYTPLELGGGGRE